MRTTLNIDDDLLAFAQGFANARGIKLGTAISELIKLGCQHVRSGSGIKTKLAAGTKDLWVFDLPEGTPQMTVAELARVMSQDESEQDEQLGGMIRPAKHKATRLAA